MDSHINLSKCVVLDLETDNLLEAVTKVHCAVIRSSSEEPMTFLPGDLSFLDLLRSYEAMGITLVGHNLVNYDLAVLEKLFGYVHKGPVLDTLVMSRLVYPDIKPRDFGLQKKGRIPAPMMGKHSLEAWGYRLGFHKGSFAKTTDWKEFSQEMLDYCVRDTEVTFRLLRHLAETGPSKKAVEIEHAFAQNIDLCTRRGVRFDVPEGLALAKELSVERAKLEAELTALIPPFVDSYVTPAKKLQRTKTTPFNPGSRAHAARALGIKYGWKPTEFTDTGEPKVDEEVLAGLEWPEAKLILNYLTIQKQLGQLSEGAKNWLQAVKEDGRIHAFINHCGAVTARCTHSGPNLAQVPKGPRFRKLFRPTEGLVMVGCDASGLELRCFGHYLAKYDNGAYATVVISGDIHTANQKAAGLPTRDNAKTFIYGLLYGAGDAKLGAITGKGRAAGAELRDRFMSAIPAYAQLISDIGEAAQRRNGILYGIDGRRLEIRHKHAALNTLLQSAGAIAMKVATNLACERLAGKAHLILHVHDEMQFECRPEHAQEVGKVAAESIAEAGQILGFQCPLAGEFRVGNNWAETH
jgi:DNA polymerase I-like protein with 3'-5' exonuclease and polymerase domains